MRLAIVSAFVIAAATAHADPHSDDLDRAVQDLPEPAMRSALRGFIDAVERDRFDAVVALVPDAGVTRFGTKTARAQFKAQLAKQGMKPYLHLGLDQRERAAGVSIEWVVAHDTPDEIWVTDMAGLMGIVPEAVFHKRDKSAGSPWLLVELREVDMGGH